MSLSPPFPFCTFPSLLSLDFLRFFFAYFFLDYISRPDIRKHCTATWLRKSTSILCWSCMRVAAVPIFLLHISGLQIRRILGLRAFLVGNFPPTYLWNYFLLKALRSYDTTQVLLFFFRHLKTFLKTFECQRHPIIFFCRKETCWED